MGISDPSLALVLVLREFGLMYMIVGMDLLSYTCWSSLSSYGV